jgi:hypothetical protein
VDRDEEASSARNPSDEEPLFVDSAMRAIIANVITPAKNFNNELPQTICEPFSSPADLDELAQKERCRGRGEKV